MISEEIAIRSIQHYMYCPHRWGLLEIDKAWAENFFVTKANLLHERVHDPEKNYTARGKKVFTAVPVYNDREEYSLYGVTDCLELTESKEGVSVGDDGRRYQICIVEYKPTKPKNEEIRPDDQMQIFAQKLCVDFVFGGDCDAVIYYADVRKRYNVPVKENFEAYDKKLKELLHEMRTYLETGQIPEIRKGQKCSGCSMKDLCMPKTSPSWNVKKELKKILADEGE